MEPVTETHVRQVDEEIENWRGIVLRDLDRFTTKHEEPLATFGLNVGELHRDASDRKITDILRFPTSGAAPATLRRDVAAWGLAGERIFEAAHAVGPQAREATDEIYAPDFRGKRMADVATAARDRFQSLLETWDRMTEDLIASCAAAAYPKLPAGADEALLRQEAEMVLSNGEAWRTLSALACSERRDLAALALSPWASSWAGVHGLRDTDLAVVRSAAIDKAKTLGTPEEQAAAEIYRDVYTLFGLRQAFVGALTAPTSLFQDGRGLGFKAAYKPDGGVDILAWRDGPRDFPPITKV